MAERRSLSWSAVDEPALAATARALAPAIGAGTLFLTGELGAGKTTFARALLGAIGVGARVKSPTYSLIESYAVGDLSIHHLDLYRIAGADELEWLGLRDLAAGRYLLVVEWPERGAGALPEPDLVVRLAHAQRGRDLVIEAGSAEGERWLDAAGLDRLPRVQTTA